MCVLGVSFLSSVFVDSLHLLVGGFWLLAEGCCLQAVINAQILYLNGIGGFVRYFCFLRFCFVVSLFCMYKLFSTLVALCLHCVARCSGLM